MSGQTAQTVLDRENGSCAVCGLHITGIGHIHHRLPRGMGGGRYANTASNLLYLHHSCHLYKVEKDRDQSYRNGWLVKAGHDPQLVPVLYKLHAWVLLDNLGNIETIDPATANAGDDI